MHDPRFDPLPDYPLQRLERLARDLAWGVYYHIWNDEFYFSRNAFKFDRKSKIPREEVKEYFSNVWNFEYPPPFLLEKFNYMNVNRLDENSWVGQLTLKSYELLDIQSFASAFISYRRVESSAFALLIISQMKAMGLTPFLDMNPDPTDGVNYLRPGSKWKQEIEAAIDNRNTFVVIVGPKTFQDESYVITELQYAIQKEKIILPIWHNSFNIDKHLPSGLEDIKNVIDTSSAIVIEKENPQQYTGAIQVLLSHFGIYP